MGRIKKGGAVGPGLFFVIPCMDEIRTVDLRTKSLDIPPQEILTKDSVTVAVDAVVFYNVQNPLHAVINVAEYAKSTKLLASTTLRNILGTRNLAEILADREKIAQNMMRHIEEATVEWGIQVKYHSRKLIKVVAPKKF